MNLHANAALSLKGRRKLRPGWLSGSGRWRRRPRPPASVSAAPASGWGATVPRERSGSAIGPRRPRRVPHRTSEQRVEAIAALRRLRFTGPEIAEVLGMAVSTVSGILARIGMGKLGRVGSSPPCGTSASVPES